MPRKPEYRAPGIPDSKTEFTGSVQCRECGMKGGSVKSRGAENFKLDLETGEFTCWICAHEDAPPSKEPYWGSDP